MQYQRRKVKNMGPAISRKKGRPWWIMLILDVLIAGIGLIVFAYFHHVNPIGVVDKEPVALPEETPIVETTPEPEETPDASEPETTPEPEEPSMFLKAGEAPVKTENTLVTEHVNAEIRSIEWGGSNVHIAEVYVSDATYLKTYLAGNDYAACWTERQNVHVLGNEVGAFVAINGDQCKAHKTGVVVRNGVLYRDTLFGDVGVLTRDGRLLTYEEKDFDISVLESEGAWQAWSFGPVLLDGNGQTMTSFNSDVCGENPRSAIGMIEPNHFLLITVDGRGEDSPGLTMSEMSQMMFELGCTSAYNLDGGATAAMAVNGEIYSTPSKERYVTDIIYVAAE